MRARPCRPGQEASHDVTRRLRLDAGHDTDTPINKPFHAATIHPIVRIAQGDDDPDDSGLDQRVGAWSSLSMMGTGFKRDICCRAPCRRARLPQRQRLGMWAACRRGMRAGHKPTIGGYDRASNRRVRRGPTFGAARLGNGDTHPSSVIGERLS